MPQLKALVRVAAIWIMLMSGAFALSREVYFAYLASNGIPVSPNNALAVIEHLAIAAFIISGVAAWWFEHQTVAANGGNPVRALTELRGLLQAGKQIINKLEQMSEPLPKPKQMEKWERSVQSIIESKSLERIMTANVTTPWINTAPTNTDGFVTDYFGRFAKHPPEKLIAAYARMVDRVSRLDNLLRQIRS